jgi:hypothetical protein
MQFTVFAFISSLCYYFLEMPGWSREAVDNFFVTLYASMTFLRRAHEPWWWHLESVFCFAPDICNKVNYTSYVADWVSSESAKGLKICLWVRMRG